MQNSAYHGIALDQVPVGLLKVSSEGAILSANKTCETLFGIEEDRLKGLRFQEITHKDDLEKDVHLLSQLITGQKTQYTVRKRYVRPDGSFLHAILNVSMVRSESNDRDYHFLAVVQDATEVFRNIEIAGLNSQKIHALTEYLDEMVWIASPGLKNFLFLNTRFESIWETSCNDAYVSPDRFVKRIHPEDEERVINALSTPQVERWEVFYKLLFDDGRIKYIRDHGQAIYDDNGEILYLVGSTTDVTKDHEREQELTRLTKELEKANKALQERVNTDVLTGALSRLAMMDVLSASVSSFHRYGTTSSIIFVDLNNFKSVNDKHGHGVGDQVLTSAVGAIKEILRTSDSVGRYGGDEFIIHLPNTDLEGARAVAEKVKLLSVMSNTDVPLLRPITFSVGLAEITSSDTCADTWLDRADNTMYHHKSSLKKVGLAYTQSENT